MSAKITQHLLYDGSMFARPCDGERNVESRPVAVPVGADATLALLFYYARSFAAVWPEALAGCTRFRFTVWADGGTLLYATAALVADADARTLSVPFGGSWTEPMKEALGTAPSRVFRAELDGFKTIADSAPAFVVVFPLAVGNRLDTGADTTPLDNLGFQYIEEYASRSAFPATGEAGKIYVAKNTNKTYRWSGTQYTKIGGDDATLTPVYSDTPTFSEWAYSGIPDGLVVEAPPRLVSDPEILQYYNWMMEFFDGNITQTLFSTSAIDSNEVVFDVPGGGAVTATRTRTDIIGYRLGSQEDKPLAPSGDYALKSEIPPVPVKVVKRSGTALTPDAQGAVDVLVPAVVAPSTSAADAGKAADAKATGDALAGKLSKAEAERGFTEWSLEDGATPSGLQLSAQPHIVIVDQESRWTVPIVGIGDIYIVGTPADANATSLSWHGQREGLEISFTATRTRLPTMADLNAKQDTISNLDTIIAGAAAGATAVQPADLTAYRTAAAQDEIDRGQNNQIVALNTSVRNAIAIAGSRLAISDAKAGYTAWECSEPSGCTIADVAYSGGTLSFTLIDSESEVYECSFSNVAEDATTVTGVPTGDFAETVTLTRTRLRPTAAQEAAWDAKLASAKRNMLDYATGTILATYIAVYRSELNADGSFPIITDMQIPTAASYFQFELELAVPDTVPAAITGPSGWSWIDGHGLPDPADLSGGETICISVRLDCTARTFLASVWRVA